MQQYMKQCPNCGAMMLHSTSFDLGILANSYQCKNCGYSTSDCDHRLTYKSKSEVDEAKTVELINRPVLPLTEISDIGHVVPKVNPTLRLNSDKIVSVGDCRRLLKFLFNDVLLLNPEDIKKFNNFQIVEGYFDIST